SLKRVPRVAAQHIDKRRPLRRGNRGERIREELLTPESAALAMKVTCYVWLTLIIDPPELGRVGLPFSRRAVQIVERVPDLVAHHVRGRRRTGADHDLAIAVGARAGVPRLLARRQ